MKFFYDLLILKTSTFQETSVVMHEKHSDKVCVENMFLSVFSTENKNVSFHATKNHLKNISQILIFKSANLVYFLRVASALSVTE